MQLEPFTTLTWAYQLHYYLCFRTHRRRACFADQSHAETLAALLAEICQRHDYHLLQFKIYPDHLRCLLSLRPQQTISAVIQTIKANTARECGIQLSLTAPVWARGYLARGVGRVRAGVVKQYIARQAEHHGYAARVRPPVFRYRAEPAVNLKAAHASFELNHHLVFATCRRAGVFTSDVGAALGGYWLRVAAKHGFAVDQITVVPDHVHLLMRIVPKRSVEDCALSLLNNGQHFVGKHFPRTLVQAGIERLWQASAYAGTCGQVTTALMKAWLSERD
jgi:putative transposase